MTARRLTVLGIALLALAAAGCGGDDSPSESASTDTVAVEETTEETTGDEVTDAAEDTTEEDGLGSLSGKCAELAGISSKLAQSLTGQTADLENVSKLFDEIADEVPEEIRDDYEVVAENFAQVAEALKDVDLTSGETPSPEALQKLQELGSTVDSAEVQQAASNIEAWAQENC